LCRQGKPGLHPNQLILAANFSSRSNSRRMLRSPFEDNLRFALAHGAPQGGATEIRFTLWRYRLSE
jgi:hypothetical protein